MFVRPQRIDFHRSLVSDSKPGAPKPEESTPENKADPDKPPETPAAAHNNKEEDSFHPLEHLDRTLKNTPIVAQMEERIKKVAHDLNVSDSMAVVGISTLVVLLLTAPYMLTHMKRSNSTYQQDLTEDPVDDLNRLFRQEFEGGRNPFEVLFRDILQSKALQDAAQQFVVQLLASDAVKRSLSRLVQQLWSDLVTDPETLAQIIRLLQIAIQDPQIRKATQTLVLDLVSEPAIQQALVDLLQRVGSDEQVLQATQGLLTQATHRSLNDPEILEHSMEFASDVVGDDVVQQSARDALWNTVGSAVKPVSTAVLLATGLGLIGFGVLVATRSMDSSMTVFVESPVVQSFLGILSSMGQRLVALPGLLVRRLWSWFVDREPKAAAA